jgi:hypothetical protein
MFQTVRAGNRSLSCDKPATNSHIVTYLVYKLVELKNRGTRYKKLVQKTEADMNV